MHASSLIPRRSPAPALAVALLLFVAADAAADEVVLKNGKVRTGEVVSEDERFVVLRTRLGRIRIRSAEVVEIRRGEPSTETPASGGTEFDPPRSEERPTAGDDTEPDVETRRGAAPADGDAGGASSEDAERRHRLRAARVVRRTGDDEAGAEEQEPEAPAAASIGGRVLGEVPKGTEVIVFQPPRRFEAAPGTIEIGRRTLARMEMAGAASAWLTTAGGDGEQRIVIRLADVKRHVEVTSPETRMRLFEGISTGDWVRLRTTSGAAVQGRLNALGNGVVNVDSVDEGQRVVRTPVPVDDIVTVDGVIRDTAAELALSDIASGEPLAVTFWPSGDQVMGRHVEAPKNVLALDLDDDGKADRTLLRDGPLANVRRVPAAHRELSVILHPGSVVRLGYRDDTPDAAVRRSTLGPIEAITAFAISVRHGDEAVVVPFDGISELTLIEDDPEEEVQRWNAKVPRDVALQELAVLPGMRSEKADSITLPEGISTVSDGLHVTHVFVAEPHSRELFGIRIGEPSSQSVRRSSLRFDTNILPRVNPDAPPEPRQLVSESIEGLRVVVLVDGLGVVTGIEISEAR